MITIWIIHLCIIVVCDNNTDYPSLSNIGLTWCKWWKHGDENVKENDKNQRNILYHNELEVNQMWNFDEYYLSTTYIEYFSHMPWSGSLGSWLVALHFVIWWKHGDENVKENDKNQRDIFEHNELVVYSKIYCEKWYLYKI